MIFAGAAAYCYGSEREITDVDILVRFEEMDDAKTALVGLGFQGFDIYGGAEIKIGQSVYPFFLDDEMVKKQSGSSSSV